MKLNDIIILPDAEEDIFNIYKYNDSMYSRRNAIKTIQNIKEKIYKLKNYPKIGIIPPELDRIMIYDYREVHSVPYRIIYQLLDNKIYIHCILDSRRDLRSLLIERLLQP
ncbi:MAG: type II toxin-antitoxin system RelE/ParE family toxin [Spirochaetales bacterium]|nr:type II toxin-antitoxin system RelE/ParE family toxin [Spirochaetales bacterium]